MLRRETLPAHRRRKGTFADEARPHRALRFGVRARGCLLGADEFRAPNRLVGGSGCPERRSKQEFALAMRRMAQEHYPRAEKIRVVLDDLSTHTAAAFYESFSAEVARQLARKIEFIYTPVHGSWLNMVEIEISVLVRQCLGRRLADIETLGREAKAWCRERNRLGASVDWRFSTEDARIKLRSLYPSTEE